MKHRRLVAFAAAFLVLCAGLLPARAQEPALVAAASSLQYALAGLATAFAAQGHPAPRLVFGSSGNISQQIAHSAPFELFMAADENYIADLHERDLVDRRGTVYGLGRLAIFAVSGSPVAVDSNLDGLARSLKDGRLRKLAIANPELAPYGRAAMEALDATALTDHVRDLLVYGENVAQAAQFAASGSVDAGLIAASLATSPAMRGTGSFAIVDEALYAPIRQAMVLTRNAGDEAEAFFAFVLGDEGRAILEQNGFGVPDAAADGG